MGSVDAFQGLVRHPYLGAKQEGALGFGKGIGRGLGGFYFHMMAGTYLDRRLGSTSNNTTSNLRSSRVLFEGY